MKPTNDEIFTIDLEIEATIFDFDLKSDFDYNLEKWWM